MGDTNAPNAISPMVKQNISKKILKTPKPLKGKKDIQDRSHQPTENPDLEVESSSESAFSIRQKRERQNQIRFHFFLALAFAIFVGIPALLIGGIKIGLALGLAPPICFLSYCYPRSSLWVFLIYMPFSGTLVYWLGGGNPLLQLAKDILYIPALIGLIVDCRKKRLPILVPSALKITLGLLVLTSLLTLIFVNGLLEFAPDCSSGDLRIFDSAGQPLVYPDGQPVLKACRSGNPFLQGILGLKILLGYIPLMFCAYYTIENRKQLLWFGRVFAIVVIICCSLGLIQFFLLKTGRCEGTRLMTGEDIFSATLGAKCLVGGALLYSPDYGEIRLPGTFVSPWHWSWFLVSGAVGCFTTAFSESIFFWRVAGLIGLGLVQINAIVCGQRLAFALVPVTIALLLILTGQIANLKRFIPLSIGLVLILSIGLSALNPGFIQQRFDSFVGRWNHSPPSTFLINQYRSATIGKPSFLGRGLGKATNSTRVFGAVTLLETFHPKLAFEIGFPGLIAFVIFSTHITILAVMVAWRLRDSYLRSVGKCLAVFVAMISFCPYWYPLDTDPVAVYYWFFAGIIFRLPSIERQKNTIPKGQLTPSIQLSKTLKVAGKQRLEPST
jgi:hypothetical protein